VVRIRRRKKFRLLFNNIFFFDNTILNLAELSFRSVMNMLCGYHENVVISKFKEGDKSAFNCIFYTYYELLVLYANQLLMDHDKAEETVQGIFVKLWLDRNQINIINSLGVYLQKSTKNKCLDILKHEKIVHNYLDKTINQSKGNYEINNINNSEDIILYTELKQKIEYSINNLPDNCREIFKLSRYEGMKYAEIAQKLNISVKTVEVHIGKALKKLRNDLKKYLII